MSNKLNFKIKQGTTFTRSIRRETLPLIYKNISSISQSAPCTLVVSSHNLRAGQLFGIQSVKGMTELNSKNLNYRATIIDENTISINSVNSIDYKPHIADTGVIVFRTVPSLVGYTARMTIRDKVGGLALYQLSTALGNITIDNSTGYITLSISAVDTADWDWTYGVYDLELVSSGGEVIELLQGSISVQKEVTV